MQTMRKKVVLEMQIINGHGDFRFRMDIKQSGTTYLYKQVKIINLFVFLDTEIRFCFSTVSKSQRNSKMQIHTKKILQTLILAYTLLILIDIYTC